MHHPINSTLSKCFYLQKKILVYKSTTYCIVYKHETNNTQKLAINTGALIVVSMLKGHPGASSISLSPYISPPLIYTLQNPRIHKFLTYRQAQRISVQNSY